ncbi:sec1 family domain containing 1 [Homo sapiens]|uniref:Sec1 family domain containing 1 n=1 Tax=Homo sapiens TaxID=9606 RepID=G3V551_HUMAN|nr:sec1 family domain containing 1 [Homo sapiens]KAI4060473.1 sec1 family domain containing 1 [Homo sapiens]
MGITLHLLLHSDRDPIPDVPAVYFVMPTEENIDRMCQASNLCSHQQEEGHGLCQP